MTRIVFISDTHGFYNACKVPDGDILIHSGDFGPHGLLSELEEFHDWLASHPHAHKIFVAGNHDWCFEQEPKESRRIMKKVTYLQDESAKIMGLTIYGSPWQPRFFDWAFNLDRGKPLAKVWAKIPKDTDVLVTHGPPYAILDQTARGPKVGCEELKKRIDQIKPRIHGFGHIHEGYGSYEHEGVLYLNASICDEHYRPVNKAHVVEIDANDKSAAIYASID